MQAVSQCIVRHARAVAAEIEAQAVLVYADAVGGGEELRHLLEAIDFRTILIGRSKDKPTAFDGCPACDWITVPNVRATRVKW